MSGDQLSIDEKLIEHTACVAAGYLSNNRAGVEDIEEVIKTIHTTLRGLISPIEVEVAAVRPQPAVPIKRSVQPDYIVCLEDGLHFKSIKRHLFVSHGMTPEEYREKWDLSDAYPMVAPNYAQQRSEFAKAQGLGQRAKRKRKKPAS